MRNFLFILFVFSSIYSFAAHLKGGTINYEFISSNAGINKYRVSVKQYLDINSTGAQIDPNVNLGIFDAKLNTLLNTIIISYTNTTVIKKNFYNSCISAQPDVAYRIDEYTTTIDLPNNINGYLLCVQRCCRSAGIVNLINPNSIGFTHTATIPSTIGTVSYLNNSNPVFNFADTAVLCTGSSFIYPNKALDIDGDSIRYSFDSAYDGGSQIDPKPNPPSSAPYNQVNYVSGFSSKFPLGSLVTMDSMSGLISGIAPTTTGDYVVAIYASEFRNGILLSKTKKEIHIVVSACQIGATQLDTLITSCNSYTINFQNNSISPNIVSYFWNFGDSNSTSNTSTLALPSHTYSDAGTYKLKFKAKTNSGCEDSAYSTVKVYPSFDFDIKQFTPICNKSQYKFLDANYTLYKTLPKYTWFIDGKLLPTHNPSIFLRPNPHPVVLVLKGYYGSSGCPETNTLFYINVADSNPVAMNNYVYPSIVGQILPNTSVTFTSQLAPLPTNVTYQWYMNNIPITGATSLSYTNNFFSNNDSIKCIAITTDSCVANKTIESNVYVAKLKPHLTINGNFRTKSGKKIKKVDLIINKINILKNIDSVFLVDTFSQLLTLKPTKNNDLAKANGVNSADVILTQRHILNTSKLNSPYKIIAADVTGDKKVNSQDVIRLRRLILGSDTTFKNTLTNENRLWVFVDSAYQFPDTTNPFPFKDSISFTNLKSNKINQSFIGVRLGDVNWDWNAAIAKQPTIDSRPSTEFQVISKNENGIVNNQFSITNNQQLSSIQSTIHFDNSKYEFVNLTGLNNLSGFEFNALKANETGNISILWVDKNGEAKEFNKGEELFTLLLRPLSTVDSRQLSLDLSLNNSITESFALNKNLDKNKIVLKQNTGQQSTLDCQQLTIYPNPSNGNVTIQSNGCKEISVIDYLGRIVKMQTFKSPSIGGVGEALNIQLNKGVYIVKAIMNNGSLKNEKLIVE